MQKSNNFNRNNKFLVKIKRFSLGEIQFRMNIFEK